MKLKIFERFEQQQDGPAKAQGIAIWQAAIFIAAQIAGSGVLALPKAASDAGGWLGLGIMLVLCVNATFAGAHLGLCWAIAERHYPDLKTHIRNPYPTLGEKAYGRWLSIVISVAMQVELIGTGTVFLLLSAQIIETLLLPYELSVNACVWLPTLAAFLCPAMWLGSPKDFWQFGVGALLTTLTTCIIATVESINDAATGLLPPPDTSVTLTPKSFFLGFGVIIFSFGGASTFPTIQNDMRHREKFPISVMVAFAAIITMYVPVTAAGFAVYGHDVQSSILNSISSGPAVVAAQILIAIHLVTAFVILTNPATQYIEHLLNIPHKFGWKRCLVRTCVLLLMVFIGETVRDFGKVLSLVGGSTTTLLNMVFPPIIYLKFKSTLEPESTVPLWRKIYLLVILVIGLVGGVAATYSAILDIVGPQSFRKPCYIP
ncbi:uncharacterized protein LOC132194139 [Neocloeon triangulifer]|uniref:uncharacterized protein LOC132194139 n=1 Tax=Neocloeon triangulifer TaxID=2078957 RepID=UPI00286F40DB|nr:uncharacterized protein LOC132194139 [Neocloeon triangulifer]